LTGWSLACPDWQERIRDGRSLIPDLPLNQADAKRAVAAFNKLCLPDVVGTPNLAEAAGDWFREIVAAMFGSYDAAAKKRLVRQLFLLVPKKNFKTTGGAALQLTALLLNKRPRAEFQLVGPTQEIADIAFSQAVGMIEADPEGFLQKRLQVQDHVKTITDRKTKAELKIKTFHADIVTGGNTVGCLIDELHLLGKRKDAARIIGQLRGGLMAKPEGYLAFITTQSDEDPTGVFLSELNKARAIRDGKLHGVPMLPVLYEFPDDIAQSEAAWRDPKNWPMVTPNRDRSVTIQRLIEDFHEAEVAGHAEVCRWASQHLNVQIGLALKSESWAGAEHWMSCADMTLTLDTLLERSEVVVGGVDGGGMDDLLGLAVLGREKDTRRWLHWGYAWGHEKVLERRADIAPRLRTLHEKNLLSLIPDNSDADVKGVADIFERIEDAGLLPEKHAIGVDQVGITEIVDELALRGFDTTPETGRVMGVRQSWMLSNTIKSTERRLAAGDLVHGGSPMMAWSVGNARVEPRGNAITITKQMAGTAKIDPLMALFNAVAVMTLNPAARGKSYLASGELLVV
jgi:phage terminase large subunit-like protein